ncbi:type VI secretion lipoprotein, VC_A0113 family [Chitinasiproducens palmae]|uniref:Type VI secretion lipoprotein, VC_A0113 family n=1 Tax=Chitinasiproducens palmae TaxID=1770053 RepID=A0A1H2PL06_9BURK|nr:type VI secretion lipoprotein, VC_A0113 family [Chitinasiproducens palmae]
MEDGPSGSGETSVAEQGARVASESMRERRAGVGRRATAMAAFALAAVALGGCSLFGGTSAKDAVAQVEWSAASDAILIEVNADDLLNEYDGEAHTLLLGVLQAGDADAFRKVAGDAGTLATALSQTTPGGPMLQTVRYVVQPGGHTILSIDRVAKAKVVGLIAGYYTMDPKTSARLFEIPLAISNNSLLGHDYAAQPQTLALRVDLGRLAIEQAVRLNPQPPELVKAEAQARAKQQIVPLDGGGREILLTPANGSQPGAAAIPLPN